MKCDSSFFFLQRYVKFWLISNNFWFHDFHCSPKFLENQIDWKIQLKNTHIMGLYSICSNIEKNKSELQKLSSIFFAYAIFLFCYVFQSFLFIVANVREQLFYSYWCSTRFHWNGIIYCVKLWTIMFRMSNNFSHASGQVYLLILIIFRCFISWLFMVFSFIYCDYRQSDLKFGLFSVILWNECRFRFYSMFNVIFYHFLQLS